MGRKIENWFIESIFQKLSKSGAKKIIIGFIPSDRNEIAEIFLKSLKLKKFTDKKILPILNVSKKERLFVKDLSNFKFNGDRYYE